MRTQGIVTAVLGAAVVLAGFATMPGLADAGLAPVDDPWGLSAKFRAHELHAMVPQLVAEDAKDGGMALALFGTVFDVELEPAPWEADVRFARLTAEGGVEVQPAPAFETLAFVGHVKGEPSSQVLVTVMESGVAGYVLTRDHYVWFEPLLVYHRDAPAGLSVAYRAVDVILPEETTDVHLRPTVDPVVEPIRVLGHEPGPSRSMTVWLDKPFYDLYGSAGFNSKATSVWNQLQSNFNTAIGFSFTLANNLLYYCDTQSCQDAWMGGATTDAVALLSAWADKVDGNGFVTYELAHLFTGKNLDGGTIGVAWQPGRYGLSQIRDEGGTYDGGASNYEAGLLASHETGHNFNGRHERATSYSHCHGTLSGSTCSGTWTTHYTIMWATLQHEPEVNWETPVEYSSDNRWWIRSCNYWDWTPGSFTPGSAGGFGYYCTN